MRCIVECLCDDARTLGRAVMVAIAVSAPFEHKGGGAHGGVMVFVTTVDAIVKVSRGLPRHGPGIGIPHPSDVDPVTAALECECPWSSSFSALLLICLSP
jgi:hypothetical protein